MLSFNKTVDHLAMENSVHWYGHVLRRRDDHVMSTLKFEFAGQMNKGRLDRTWWKHAEEEMMNVDLCCDDALFRSK